MESIDAKVSKMSIAVPSSLYSKFKDKAAIDGFSLNEAVCSLIYNYVNGTYSK